MKTRKRSNTYEDILCVIGIGGGVVTLLVPYLVPYLGDVVWVSTLTVLGLWAIKRSLRRDPEMTPDSLLRPPLLKWTMLVAATNGVVLPLLAELLQVTFEGFPGVGDVNDFYAFGAGYVVTLLLLAGAYRTYKQGGVQSILW